MTRSDPLLPVVFQRIGRSRTSLNGQEQTSRPRPRHAAKRHRLEAHRWLDASGSVLDGLDAKSLKMRKVVFHGLELFERMSECPFQLVTSPMTRVR